MIKTKKNIYPSLLAYLAFEETVLLPGGILPLHVQDPMDMFAIEQALGQNRFLAVVQAKNKTTTQQVLYKVGCLGQIVTFSEASDGSIFVLIKGIQRLVVEKEVKQDVPVSLMKVKYPIQPKKPLHKDSSDFDRSHLVDLVRDYIKDTGIQLNFDDLIKATDESLVVSLTMGCPFKGPEKQAILESNSLSEQLHKVTAYLEVAQLLKGSGGSSYIQ